MSSIEEPFEYRGIYFYPSLQKTRIFGYEILNTLNGSIRIENGTAAKTDQIFSVFCVEFPTDVVDEISENLQIQGKFVVSSIALITLKRTDSQRFLVFFIEYFTTLVELHYY